MKYWRESFGFYAVISACSTFAVLLTIVIFWDIRMQRKLLEKLYDKVAAYEREVAGENDLFAHREGGGGDRSDEDDGTEKPEKKKKKKKISKKQAAKKGDEKSHVLPFEKENEEDNFLRIPKQKRKNKKKNGKKVAEEDEYEMIQKSKEEDEPLNDNTRGTPESDQPHPTGKKYRQEKTDKNDLQDEEEEDLLKPKEMTEEEKEEERRQFSLKHLLIHGNSIVSLLMVTSIVSPRHVRGTMLYSNIVLLWFWCAVIFNNTKDPLEIPDFSRQARNLAANELWVSFLAPWGTMLLMYIFAILFKISDIRIRDSFKQDTRYLTHMLVELRKEMKLRYVMAYFITFCVFSSVFWYVIKFTASFGWKVSWVWWYTGTMAFFLNFLLYDPLISVTHWVIYNCSRSSAICIMKVRGLKIAKAEA